MRRLPHPTDRRVWLVHITPAGEALVATINELDHGLREQLRAGLTREDRQRQAAILVQIQHNLAREGPAAEQPAPHKENRCCVGPRNS